MYLTENFEPRRVLERFEDICAIPHGSGHEQALGDWVIALAEKRGHEAIRDAAGNILVRVAASPGCEAAPPILLQGHLDMVLAQEEGLGRDMIREPVHLVLEGSILRADRTTLGADNAVGLCHMLALMDADDLRHPPMELLFTVCEEEGLQGIQAFDLSQLRARRMINMDMGDPDCMVIGSAGSAKLTVSRPCPAAEPEGRLPVHGVLLPAGLGALSPVPAPPADEGGEEASSGEAVAQGPLHEDLRLHGGVPHDVLQLLERQFAVQDRTGYPVPRTPF